MLTIRPMTADDLPLGMHLKQQAGWNQTEADWRRLLDLQPDGCFVAEWDGTSVGTTTTCIFGPVAWVAMVLVEATHRGRGIGAALMEHALTFLDNRHVRSVRLDATPLGRPLYERLGFTAEYDLTRYGGAVPHAAAVPEVTPMSAADLDAVLELDRRVTGTDRGVLLRRLFTERPADWRVLRRDGRLDGFLTHRPGALATLVGPCVAAGTAGAALLLDFCHRHPGEGVFVDVPDDNGPAVALVRGWGLEPRRPLTRMVRGPAVAERRADLWASSGPEMG